LCKFSASSKAEGYGRLALPLNMPLIGFEHDKIDDYIQYAANNYYKISH